MPIYMKYEGIEGQARGRYTGWIELESCQMGNHRHASSPSGWKVGAPPNVSEIVATKIQDCTSVQLFKESVFGGTGKKVTIDFVGGNAAPYMSIELENTLVSSYQVSPAPGVNGERPHESFSLNATKIYYSSEPTASSTKLGRPSWGRTVSTP